VYVCISRVVVLNKTPVGVVVVVVVVAAAAVDAEKARTDLLLRVLLGRLLGEEDGVDVGEDTTVGDGDTTKELGELLVVADSKLDVAGDDAGLLVVASGVTGELENLGAEVLEDGGKVHGGTSTDAVSVLALLEEAGNTANGELETSLGGARNGLLAGGSATLSHDERLLNDTSVK